MNPSNSSPWLFLDAPGLIGNYVIPALIKNGFSVLADSRRGFFYRWRWFAKGLAALYSVALWLSAFDCIVRRGQAIFVLGLIVLLMYATVEFLFFIGLMSQQGLLVQAQSEARNLD